MKPSIMKQKSTYKIYNAINKYGKSHFYYEILEDKIPKDLLNYKEINYIEQFDSFKNGYNSTKGGDGKLINKLEDLDKIISLCEKGKTLKEIGDMYNVHEITVQRFIYSNNYYIHDTIDKDILQKLFNDGLSNREIAEKMNTKPWTIERYLHKNGLKRNRIKLQNRTDIDFDLIKEDYLNGMHIKDICIKHDLDQKTYYKIKKDNNFEMKQGESMKIYYAHHIWKYGTKIEKYELDLIHKTFANAEILNPNGRLGYTENSGLSEKEIMNICFEAIKSCDAIVFSSVDGVIGKGVSEEVSLAQELSLKIFYINNNSLIHIEKFSFSIINNSETRRLYAIVNY